MCEKDDGQYILVPREITPEMFSAAWGAAGDYFDAFGLDEGAAEVILPMAYDAMLIAAEKSKDECRNPDHQEKRRQRDEDEVIDEFRVNCLMNARYHHSRERYLISWHRWIMFFVIVIGTASVSDLVKDVSYLNELIDQNTAKAIFGAMSAFLCALDLAFDFSTRASAHSVLKSRYYNLLSSFIDNQITLTKANAQLAEISADEEPAFYALMNLSWNAAQESVYGDDADSYKIGFFKRLLKNVFTFEGTKFELETRNRGQLYNNPL